MNIVKPSQTCLCCGHWIQIETFDICPICSWQEEGQKESDAHEIWGGANGDYSLREAQENFKQYKTMYRPSDPKFPK